jgi:hypothetical protein
VAIRNAGWKFYLFYACWDALGVVVIYFTVSPLLHLKRGKGTIHSATQFVETKGYQLEEIDALFEGGHPVRDSKRGVRTAVAQRDGTQSAAVVSGH